MLTKDGMPLTFEAPAVRTNGHEEESRSDKRWPDPLSDAAFQGLAGEYVRLVERLAKLIRRRCCCNF